MSSLAAVRPGKRTYGVWYALILVVLCMATALRFHKLGVQSFWNDEGNSARLSERPPALIIEGTASDVHPPLYYLLLRGWRELVGDSEFGLRSFSAFAGILTVAAAVAAAELLFARAGAGAKRRTAVVTAVFLCAVNPALVYYSQEARMYALLALIVILSMVVLLRWLDARNPWPWAAAYVLLTTAGHYTHYFYPVFLVIQGFVVCFWVIRKEITLAFDPLKLTAVPNWSRRPLYWLLAVLASLAFYAPWLPIFLRQTGGRAGERPPLPEFAWDSLRWMLLGQTVGPGELAIVPFIAAVVLIWAVFAAGRRVLIPALAVLVTILAMVVAGTTSFAYFKFMLPAVPFLAIWLVGPMLRPLPAGEPLRGVARLALAAAMIAVAAGMFLSLRNLYNEPQFARADYRAIAAAVEAGPTNSGVILVAPNQWEVFTYYHREGASVYPLPKGQPDPAILTPELEKITARHDRVYALYWGDDLQDPQRVIEGWLDRNLFKASESWIGDVRVAVYAVSAAQSAPSLTPLDIQFANGIVLEGVVHGDGRAQPGAIAPITLLWSTSAPLHERYKVFVHLLDEAGQIVAQHDSEPAGGAAPTDNWTAGEQIADNHGILLPPALAPGEYRLLAGLYAFDDPQQRLKVTGGTAGQDVVDLGTISVLGGSEN